MKLCKDCKYYEPRTHPSYSSVCVRPGDPDPVDGKQAPIRKACFVERRGGFSFLFINFPGPGGSCGECAVYFEPRKPQ